MACDEWGRRAAMPSSTDKTNFPPSSTTTGALGVLKSREGGVMLGAHYGADNIFLNIKLSALTDYG